MDSYDEVPYHSAPFAETHPVNLAVLGRLFGLEPPDPDRCRFLELGCASGGNLIPMAVHLPGGWFEGIELSAAQAADGASLVAELGLANARIRQGDILDLGDDLGEFDYIVTHGVYSWVPEVVQERILGLCAEHLAPGGVAYRCSFRVTEAVHMIERMADIMAHDLGEDPAAFRMKNFIKPEQFPYKSPTGWEYDSGNYAEALRVAMDMIGYDELRNEQAEKRARGELMGIGISSFTEVVGAGPSRDYDILGIKMFDSAEIRIHPTGKAIARFGTKSQGQGHETTYALIIAEELGLPANDIEVEEGDTDTAPYGLGTYASRSTPTAGAAAAMAARKIRAKARKIAAYLLEVGEDDLEWHVDRWQVQGSPDQAKTIQDIAFAAYTNHPPGMEAGLEATDYYDPPNLTFPFGSYIAVVDIDSGTGEVKVRRFVAVDDCGNIINPLVVEGQIHGGLTMGLAPALFEEIVYDENGVNLTGTFSDYLLPTAVETPKWELGKTITPSPHHPIGAKGVGESPTVGAPPAIANAVVDALWHLGVRHIDIPITPYKVWKILRERGVTD